MSLSNLLEEMTVFAKAQPLPDDPDGDPDDEDIQAAAAAANADNASQEAGAADGGAEDEGGDDKGMVKSFSLSWKAASVSKPTTPPNSSSPWVPAWRRFAANRSASCSRLSRSSSPRRQNSPT